MGNDVGPSDDTGKSPLHGSSESMDVDMPESVETSHRPHTFQDGCPYCSGLCSKRLLQKDSNGHPSSGAGSGPTRSYVGSSSVGRCEDSTVPETDLTVGSSSCGSRGNPAATGYGIGDRSRGNPAASSNGIGDNGTAFASGVLSLDNIIGHGAVGSDISKDPRRFPVNNPGLNGMDVSPSFQAGYQAGFSAGYEAGRAEFLARAVNAAIGKDGSHQRDPQTGEFRGEERAHIVANDNGVGAVAAAAIPPGNYTQNGNHDHRAPEIPMGSFPSHQPNETNVTGRGGGEISGFRVEEVNVIHPNSSVGLSPPIPSHSDCNTGPEVNVLGLTGVDKEGIIRDAEKRSRRSASPSSTHPDSRKSSWSAKARSMCHNLGMSSQTSTSKSRRNKSGSRHEDVNGGETCGTGPTTLYPDLTHFKKEEKDTPMQNKFRKSPESQQEKLLADYTMEVFHEAMPAEGPSNQANPAAAAAAAPPDCTICITSLADTSCYQTPEDTSRDLVGCVALKLCGHHFHTSCLKQMASHDSSCFTCPNCLTIHGVRIGTQPKGGKMDYRKYGGNLPGFPRSSGTIEISYSFRHGNQGPEHPNPGRPYRLVGFPRVAYLPDTSKGNKVLKLLQLAFDRRLIFTVGTSATSGAPDCVVWNGIHHKTSTHDSTGHGYPDPNYLDNVLLELASFGVV